MVFITRKELTRKGILFLFGGITLFSFIVFGIMAPPVEPKTAHVEALLPVTSTDKVIEVEEVATSTDTTPVLDATDSATSTNINLSNEINNAPQNVAPTSTPPVLIQNTQLETEKIENKSNLYVVTRVVDGDTFDVNIDGATKRVRVIGLDTPETVDPRKPVQCFGKEASNKATELLLNKKVKLEADPTQGDTDKYGRILRYATREDGLFFNKWMIENGYGHEYTYNTPYKYQIEFKQAQKAAQEAKKGLWADNACAAAPTTATTPTISKTTPVVTTKEAQPTAGCLIKGNINTKGEKLYHLPSCPSYSKTTISEGDGEKWFCTEQEAVKAGWTKAGNC